jgi:hypothetical protein
MKKIIAFLLLVLASSNAYAIAEPVQMGYLNGTGQFLPYTSSNPLPLSVSASTGITGTLPVTNGGTAGNGTTNAQTGTAYTLVLGDAGNIITASNTSANTITIPLNATVAYPIGTQINVIQYGAGASSIVATGGVTIRYVSTLNFVGQWSRVILTKIGTNEWAADGGLQ